MLTINYIYVNTIFCYKITTDPIHTCALFLFPAQLHVHTCPVFRYEYTYIPKYTNVYTYMLHIYIYMCTLPFLQLW